MNLKRIISEEINRFLAEETNLFLVEKKKSEGSKKKKKKKKNSKKKKHKKGEKYEDDRDIKRNFIKLKNGRRGDFNKKRDKETNPDITIADANDLIAKVNQPGINQAGIAYKMYPDLTPNGAQSKFRKKVKRLKTDSGNTYKFKEKEARRLNAILNKMGM